MLMLIMVDMVMEDMLMVFLMDMATDMVIIMARGLLKLKLLQMLLLMAKGPLSHMGLLVMFMVWELLGIQVMPPAMLVEQYMAIHLIIMARGLLMLMLTMDVKLKRTYTPFRVNDP